MRWVVGDVQGCARELEALLEEVSFDAARDELVSVGDLVNKGPDSLAALRLWHDVGGRGVLGNHDVYALCAHSGRMQRRPSDTLQALLDAPDAQELLDSLRALPVMLQLPGRGTDGGAATWVVHGGVHPAWHDLEATAARLDARPHDDDWLLGPEVSFAMRVRCCTPDGEMSDHVGPPEACPAPYQPWDAFYRGESRVVHGHWAMRGHYRSANTIGLDSGCVYGRELTAWCLEEDRIVSIPAR
jgi:bis(5'-nucleosyl)-tetraphosphatase (symmetrical)